MSGESQRDDDPDFLDDDFIIEDLAAKNEELDSLFEQPEGGAAPNAPAETDAEDLLFTDHSRAPVFEGRQQFAEGQNSDWDGEKLDLESMETPPAAEGVAGEDPALAAAEQSFTKELDSLLKGEEEFGPDSEGELEVIGAEPGASNDGIAEFEQSGPFVLDDGDGAWQDDAAKPAEAGAEDAEAETVGLGMPREASTDDAGEVEPGWEPLPAASVDQLAEVGDVERTDEGAEAGVESYEGADAQQFTAPGSGGFQPALVGAEVEGHDIYAEEEPVTEVVGTTELRRRSTRVFVSIAATMAILLGGAVTVWKPEWIGLGRAPERVQVVELVRPNVAVTVPVPEVVPQPLDEEPRPDKPSVVVVPPTEPKPADPGTVTPPTEVPTEPKPVDPVAVTPPPTTDPAPVTPTDTVPTPVVPTPTPEGQNGWPVREVPVAQAPTAPSKPALIRVNEDLLIGEPDDSVRTKAPAGATVMPGARAFAQLANGNYFIGSVKAVDAERLTLKVDTGEVTLQVAALAKLTELGSADYAELQRVTSGFVRLTNNNRLVGGILSGIADDHVVLEFRSNRVMLPRSAVGQVVSGESDAAVRLDTTREEDDWLRHLVERQVGNGAPPVPAPAPPAEGRSPR